MLGHWSTPTTALSICPRCPHEVTKATRRQGPEYLTIQVQNLTVNLGVLFLVTVRRAPPWSLSHCSIPISQDLLKLAANNCLFSHVGNIRIYGIVSSLLCTTCKYKDGKNPSPKVVHTSKWDRTLAPLKKLP